MARGMGAVHQGQAEMFDTPALQREADQAATVFGHEVDRLGGRHLGRDHQVALVFAVLVVDQDEHPALARLLDDLPDRRQDTLIVGAEARVGRGAHGLAASRAT